MVGKNRQITEYAKFLKDAEETCAKAMEQISNMRDDPKHCLLELLNQLYMVSADAQKLGFQSLISFLHNSIQLLEKMTHLKTSTQDLDKFVYIVSRIVYELSDRIDKLKANESERKAEVFTEEVPIESNDGESEVPQLQSFVSFQYQHQNYLLDSANVEQVFAWDKSLEHKLPYDDSRFSGAMVHRGMLIPILRTETDYKNEFKSIIVCKISNSLFALTSIEVDPFVELAKEKFEQQKVFNPDILEI